MHDIQDSVIKELLINIIYMYAHAHTRVSNQRSRHEIMHTCIWHTENRGSFSLWWFFYMSWPHHKYVAFVPIHVLHEIVNTSCEHIYIYIYIYICIHTYIHTYTLLNKLDVWMTDLCCTCVAVVEKCVNVCNFPWLLSNAYDKETGRRLAEVTIHIHIHTRI